MRRNLMVTALVLTLGVSSGSHLAAQPTSTPTQSGDVGDDRDGGFDLGWVGLLGLAGLMGLKRDHTRRHDVGHATTGR